MVVQLLTCHSIILKYIKNISNKLAINGKLTNAFVNSSTNIKIAYYTWLGHVVGGTTTDLGRFDHVIPDGCTFVGMLLTPRCTIDITLSHYGTDIYATSKDFTGDIYYDALIIYST